ncbi:MAG: DUF5691 domain-containing protein [Candidatus Melainabacteria bacterium]|nr:DUF5691 domain-containing protein [Candidatus Melainabacteria bacterium]
MTVKDNLVTAALLGTENYSLEPLSNVDETSRLETLINKALTSEAMTVESRLLSASALMFSYRRAGYIPLKAEDSSEFEQSENDTRPVISERLSQAFRQLTEDFPRLLSEWFKTIDQSAKKLPEDLLPELLDFLTTHKQPPIDPKILRRVIGPRGEWLCNLNPEWKILGDKIISVNPNLFETGDFNARCKALELIREEDPAQARDLIKNTWQENIPAEKTAFIKILENKLSAEDEPLLEFALDDSRMEVRQAAADLLAFLPDAAFNHRMYERFKNIVNIKKGILSSKIEVNVNFEYNKDMKRDGISQKVDYVQGEKAGLLVQILNYINPEHIIKSSGLAADKLLKIITESEWKDTLLTGFAQAAIKFKNQELLLSMLLSDIPYLLEIEMFGQLQDNNKEKVVASWVEKSSGNVMAAHNGFRHIECINRMEYPWSRKMSDKIMTAMQKMLTEKNNEYFLAPLALTVASYADSSILDNLDKSTSDCAYLSDTSISRIHSLITLRKTILSTSVSS